VIPENSDTIPKPAAPVQIGREGPPAGLVRWLGFALIFGTVLVSIWLVLNPVWIARFGSWGYLGAFLVNVLASASIFMPVPGLPIAIALSVSMAPLPLALATAAGSAIGELAGYALGYGGRALTKEERISTWVPRIEGWTRQYGAYAIFGVAALPLPFDFAGIAAGAGKMAIWRFLVATFLGKFIKYYIVILVSSGSLVGVRDMMGW
jgi:membrane protein YqaA with SNARE-associated domain